MRAGQNHSAVSSPHATGPSAAVLGGCKQAAPGRPGSARRVSVWSRRGRGSHPRRPGRATPQGRRPSRRATGSIEAKRERNDISVPLRRVTGMTGLRNDQCLAVPPGLYAARWTPDVPLHWSSRTPRWAGVAATPLWVSPAGGRRALPEGWEGDTPLCDARAGFSTALGAALGAVGGASLGGSGRSPYRSTSSSSTAILL